MLKPAVAYEKFGSLIAEIEFDKGFIGKVSEYHQYLSSYFAQLTLPLSNQLLFDAKLVVKFKPYPNDDKYSACNSWLQLVV